ncbi:MAG: hypothetical protein AB3N16_08700 [Flavobacteriaceae bacterium]
MKTFKKQICIGMVMVLALALMGCPSQGDRQQTLMVSEESQKALEAHVILMDQAHELSEQYKMMRLDTINKYLGIKDHSNYWFSLDVLKAYIDYVEKNAPEGSQNLGIRIYNGVYPEGFSKRVSEGFSTVYLVPTAQRKDVSNGFAPQNRVNEDLHMLLAFNFGQCCNY